MEDIIIFVIFIGLVVLIRNQCNSDDIGDFNPAYYCRNSHIQIILYMMRNWIISYCDKTKFKQNIIKLPDQDTVSLDWYGDYTPNNPIIICCPGVTGTNEDLRHWMSVLKSQKWNPCVFNRRGHNNKSSHINIYGNTQDLHYVIQQINTPDPIILLGLSAGSALIIRYLGEYSNKRVIAGVAIGPGYNTDVCTKRINPLWDRLMVERLKTFLIKPMQKNTENKQIIKKCLDAQTVDDFVHHHIGFSKYTSWSEYDQKCNPIHVVGNIRVPVLVMNARDDPIANIANVDDHRDYFAKYPKTELIETQYGSHCAYIQSIGDLIYPNYGWQEEQVIRWLCKKLKLKYIIK